MISEHNIYVLIGASLVISGLLIQILILIEFRIERSIKNVIMSCVLVSLAILIQHFKLGYELSAFDYLYIAIVGASVLMKVIEKAYLRDSKTEQVLKEEREWKKKTFRR